MPRTAFILSGGGARGAAQVGILANFEAHEIYPDYIVGTSIGSIIGGLYASGSNANEISEVITKSNWEEIFAFSESNNRTDLFLDQKIEADKFLIDFKFKNFKFILPQAISLGNKFNLFLHELFWDAIFKPDNDFNDLKYPFRAVATELISGQSVPFSEGNIVKIVRASSTIPLRYTPVQINGGIYVDGGILSNIPIEHAALFEPDINVVFNTTSALLKEEELTAPWNIADQAISIAMKSIENQALQKAEIVITPPLGSHKNSDFNGLDSLIQIGFDAAAVHIEKFIQLYDEILIDNIQKKLKKIWNHNNQIFVKFHDLEYSDSAYFKNDFYSREILTEILAELFKSTFYDNFVISLKNNDIIIHANKKVKLEFLDATNNYPDFLNTTMSNLLINNYNKPITKKLVNHIKDVINRKFRDNGYSAGGVTSFKVIKDSIFLEIGRGIISKINIASEDGTNSFLINRDLIISENEPFNATNAALSWYNLSTSDFFSDVNIELSNSNLDSLEININTIEKGSQSILIGARIDNERNGQIAFEAVQKNIFNRGPSFSIGFDGGTQNQKYFARLSNQRIWESLFFLDLRYFYSKRNFFQYFLNQANPRDRFSNFRERNFVEERLAGSIGIGRQIQRSGILSVTFRHEDQRIFHIDSSNREDFSQINTILFKALFDTRDNNNFANKGSSLLLSLETNVLKGEGTEGFSKAIVELKNYETFGKHTFIPRFIFGAADRTLPNPEFFQLGGEDSFYGMREDEERGRQIFTSSLEYRYKIPLQLWFDTYFSVRYDLGTTWLFPEDVKFSSLKHGIGSRLSWDTPIGPATLSVGRAFKFLDNPPTVSWGETMLYFSVGMQL